MSSEHISASPVLDKPDYRKISHDSDTKRNDSTDGNPPATEPDEVDLHDVQRLFTHGVITNEFNINILNRCHDSLQNIHCNLESAREYTSLKPGRNNIL